MNRFAAFALVLIASASATANAQDRRRGAEPEAVQEVAAPAERPVREVAGDADVATITSLCAGHEAGSVSHAACTETLTSLDGDRDGRVPVQQAQELYGDIIIGNMPLDNFED